jgi:DNA-binding cell septation regulator SpoVG
MTVTANVFKINGKVIKGKASVLIDEAIAINDILIKEKRDNSGLYLEFPTHTYEKNGERTRRNVCFPVTSEARAAITDVVMAEFNKE